MSHSIKRSGRNVKKVVGHKRSTVPVGAFVSVKRPVLGTWRSSEECVEGFKLEEVVHCVSDGVDDGAYSKDVNA